MTCLTAPLGECFSTAQPTKRKRRQAFITATENIDARIEGFIMDDVKEFTDLTSSPLSSDLMYVVNPDFPAFHPRKRDFKSMWPLAGGGGVETTFPTERTLLDGLSWLGAKRSEWQGLNTLEALKSQKWVRSSQLFIAGDSTGKDDVTAWTADRTLFPFISASFLFSHVLSYVPFHFPLG